MENKDKSIIPVRGNSLGLFERVGSIFRKKEIDLNLARQILRDVVDTSEEILTEDSDFSKIGQYSTKQLWEAIKLVSLDVVTNNGGSLDELKNKNATFITKPTRLGQLAFAVYQLNNKPTDVTLQLGEDRGYILQSSIPISEPKSVSSLFTRFYDKRRDIDTFKTPEGVFDLQTLKMSWRGLRWLSANILDWNGVFKLPEDLDYDTARLNSPK